MDTLGRDEELRTLHAFLDRPAGRARRPLDGEAGIVARRSSGAPPSPPPHARLAMWCSRRGRPRPSEEPVRGGPPNLLAPGLGDEIAGVALGAATATALVGCAAPRGSGGPSPPDAPGNRGRDARAHVPASKPGLLLVAIRRRAVARPPECRARLRSRSGGRPPRARRGIARVPGRSEPAPGAGARPDERPVFERLEVRPAEPRCGSALLLGQRLGRDVPAPVTLRRLYEAVGRRRNPFFALELGRALRDRGRRPGAGRRAPAGAGRPWRALVQERLASLPPGTARAARSGRCAPPASRQGGSLSRRTPRWTLPSRPVCW